MKPSDQEQTSFSARNAERVPVDTSARLSAASRYDVEVRIRDVSTAGFLAECDDSLGIGSFVSIEVPGIGLVRAQVRWQLGPRMGGMFLDPISLDQCEWVAVRAKAA